MTEKSSFRAFSIICRWISLYSLSPKAFMELIFSSVCSFTLRISSLTVSSGTSSEADSKTGIPSFSISSASSSALLIFSRRPPKIRFTVFLPTRTRITRRIIKLIITYCICITHQILCEIIFFANKAAAVSIFGATEQTILSCSSLMPSLYFCTSARHCLCAASISFLL